MAVFETLDINQINLFINLPTTIDHFLAFANGNTRELCIQLLQSPYDENIIKKSKEEVSSLTSKFKII